MLFKDFAQKLGFGDDIANVARGNNSEQMCIRDRSYTSLPIQVDDAFSAAIVLGDDRHALVHQRETALAVVVEGTVSAFTVEAHPQQRVNILLHMYCLLIFYLTPNWKSG